MSQSRPEAMPPLAVLAFTATSGAGPGRAALGALVRGSRTALRPNDFTRLALPTFIGRVNGLEDLPLPGHWSAWDCRNHRLAWLALTQDGFLDEARAAIARHGPSRVAVLMGTSTSSIGASEEAYTRLSADGQFPPDLSHAEVHSPHALGAFVAQVLGTTGPCMTVATACSSSAKVFAQAERLIRCGLVDAAVVGGVDSLCNSVLFGFNSLGLVSSHLCRPFHAERDGINLAEAGGFVLLARASTQAGQGAPLQLIGHGESSDAHHMSSPHPEGLGARDAMWQALARAAIGPAEVDYINLHGTATPKNDEVEARAVADVFPTSTRASSTKGWTGHALGAAGVLESVLTLLALKEGWVPGTLHGQQPDPCLGEHFGRMLQGQTVDAPIQIAMSNSFGFGGNNCSLVFAR
ncbi:beta-ketoacyl-[acyl-carrier-protein] synthase family protein [Aquabacterium sp.]|uniref:beta-ketoacyl-[acyl-carrier-protein] synthase family protein n=1 Tax=Aquabacterium sp. TaxID=1872578 RepID=UPI002486D137|nr:beta-ketoacyl-[acyl-carrier-protein] synthase family protein [Aquabacterium sp.]MDI1258443.1 beta-ketoacyl-[acyl-carrier-protein] synthase family protein [Aquabacterium sp.]